MIERALCSAAATASFFFVVSMLYFASHGENLRAAGLGLLSIVTALVTRRLKQRIGVTFGALVIGIVAGMIVVTTVFPYRETAAAWGLTPETLPAQIAFAVLYPLGTFLGVLGATYVWPPSRFFPPGQRKSSETH